jgi:nitrate/nitrite-specific signal transduction histidine kinase
LLLVAVVSATGWVLRRQRDDSLVVNLSGRQRMLTQRMTHQLLTYSSRLDAAADVADARARVRGTMRVFETTLDALDQGGPAPIDLQMASFRDVPAASRPVAARLALVRSTYQPYREAAQKILTGDLSARAAGIETIVTIESDLLAEMDAAVSLLQREAEAKVNELFLIQGAALALSLLFTVALMRWVRSSVTEPLERLREAAEEMSLGNLHKSVPVSGSAELRSLGESFDRMRTSLRTLLTSSRHNDAVAVEIADW